MLLSAPWGFRIAWAVALCLGCSSYREQLQRGREYYEDNQFERALSLWRHLERRQLDMTATEMARYAYLRGMTDYRLGYWVEARYWLSLADAQEQSSPGALAPDWLPRLRQALAQARRGRLGLASAERSLVQRIELPRPAPLAVRSQSDAGAP